MEVSQVLIHFLAQLGVISLALTIFSLSRDHMQGRLSFTRRFANGILFGLTAVLLMHMPGELVDEFRFDLRIVPLAVVGLVSGPVGAAVAAFCASSARLWIGGAGASLGLLGIWITFVVACIGHLLVKRGSRASDIPVFGLLNAAVSFSFILIVPSEVREELLRDNVHLVLLLMNFAGTAIAAFFVRLDENRREHARSNALHRQIVNALPDALNVKDLRGRFLLANQATAKLMGASNPAEMVGKSDFDYYRQDEAALFWAQEQQFIADPIPSVLEQQFERNGQTIYLRTIKAPYTDPDGALVGIVSHTSDVTEQKSLQAELIATQALLETAMTEMADGLALFDCDGRLLMWNRRYLEFFTYVDDLSCYGRTLAELLTAGVLRGQISVPADVAPMAWVEEEVERSRSAAQSELRLTDGRCVAKTTRPLSDGGWVTLYSDISEKKAAVHQLEYLATKDGLTDLYNRRTFDRELARAFQISRDSVTDLSLLMIDVDYFKAYNDTYGHPAGDAVLQQVANVLQSACRTQVDVVARYGGEEFAIILPGTFAEVSHDIAVRLSAAVRMLEIPHVGSPKGRVTISIGLASADDEVADCQHLLKRCDEALYAAKAAGRDKVCASTISLADTRPTGRLAAAATAP
ncbi:MAG: diguanylate cyclase [Rhizobiaceae bacterium]|nr:diguanylate cyclase [Rhizobiaceae bacterium]MCZ8352632.1 diguanylate cyclase [Rhizobium sp.]